MAVITISKEYATQSKELAEKLAEKLGYEYVGKELLADIARELNMSESEAEVFSKASSSRILRLVDRYTCSIVQKVVDREHGCLDDDNYYNAINKLVEQAYEAGNVILLGWGGQCILQGKPNTLHVRLTQDTDQKIKEAMAGKKVDEAAAKRLVETEENDSRAYIKQYFKEDWSDAGLYDLVIDMGENSLDQAVETILGSLKKRGLT